MAARSLQSCMLSPECPQSQGWPWPPSVGRRADQAAQPSTALLASLVIPLSFSFFTCQVGLAAGPPCQSCREDGRSTPQRESCRCSGGLGAWSVPALHSYRLQYLTSVLPWASDSTSLSLSFFLCKMGPACEALPRAWRRGPSRMTS